MIPCALRQYYPTRIPYVLASKKQSDCGNPMVKIPIHADCRAIKTMARNDECVFCRSALQADKSRHKIVWNDFKQLCWPAKRKARQNKNLLRNTNQLRRILVPSLPFQGEG